MRILLDTNRLTDALRKNEEIARLLDEASEIWVPFISVAEIKAGFLLGGRASQNEGLLQAFLRLSGVGVLFADGETMEAYARLFAYLRRAGTPIPTNDLWIASLAVQHQLALLTRDEHFRKLPQVSRI